MQHVLLSEVVGFRLNMAVLRLLWTNWFLHRVSPDIQYHVACLSNDQAYYHFEYKGIDCFTIKAPKLGPARVIAYDMMAINYALEGY